MSYFWIPDRHFVASGMTTSDYFNSLLKHDRLALKGDGKRLISRKAISI
jgi:hypothetical protein